MTRDTFKAKGSPVGVEEAFEEYHKADHRDPAEARKGNTPIAELIADYESNGCDHSDMEWVRRAALHYVDTMQDSQVRCLLYTLASTPADEGFSAADMMDARQAGREEAQQAAGFSAGDMADAAAQGFRDGVASVGAVDEAMVRKVAKAINAELEGEENFALAWQRLGSNERKLRDRMARAALAAAAKGGGAK